ncbi:MULTISPECIES: hypothetical protein [Bacillus]|uniref:Uncharacterized protein n=1 Tax=Bacillus velezensis TaxID=492670 RepID=A0A7W4LX26_BACVE|nr:MULTISPECIES: hypothetical protein [Bacillus]AXS61805.1 hypothetical protein CK238_14470 [Bacillus velezensis]AYV16669.1 hypothetical protein EEB07_04110 [Bacillus velezensis]MCU9590679.1 hypothetical protein [Bacillus velezensis]MEC0377925.1 hypothetical protein [Bacillus velezensis]PJN83803.1 hypothetical protein CV739_15075 [Bacillus velezensis]
MNIDVEIFKMAQEVKCAKSVKNVFWASSFLKSKGDRWKKRLYFFLGVVSIIAYFFIGREFLFKNLYYSLEDLTAKLDISKSNAIILTISLSIFPIMVIIAVTLRKYAMLVDRKWGISDLYYSLSYKALKKYLHRKNYNNKVIEKRILPYIISKNSNLELYSIGSFLKIVIPSIVVSIPVSIFGVLFTTSINESASLVEFKGFLLTLGSITIMLWFIGATSFKALPTLSIFSEKKAYKELERILQGYLLEKEIKLGSRKKIKRKV